MAVYAQIKVSFQDNGDGNANQIRQALTGGIGGAGEGPFRRIGTASYIAVDEEEQEVISAVSRCMNLIRENHDALDHFSLVMARETV